MKLVVLGGGEHARVVIEAARSRGDLWTVLGYVDPRRQTDTESRLGVAHLGSDDEGLRLATNADVRFILGFAALATRDARATTVRRYESAGVRWASIAHAAAWVSPTAILEDGVLVCGGAMINTGARIGAHATINTAAVIEHDVNVGAFTHVATAAAIGGAVTLGAGSYIGLGARIRDHVSIGEGSVVAMGAVVVGDVEPSTTVFGHPARKKEERE